MPSWPPISAVELRHPYRSQGVLHVVQAPQEPRYTLVVPFSRPWAWPRWLACFFAVWLPPQTEVIALVDYDDQSFYEQVTEGMRTLLATHQSLCGARVVWTRQAPLDEWADLSARRRRIAGNWGTFLAEAQGTVLLGAEDVSVPLVDSAEVLAQACVDRCR